MSGSVDLLQIAIPTLRTPRLELVPIAAAHHDAYAAMYGDPDVMRHIGTPLDRGGAWQVMARLAGQWILRGCGGWSVRRRGSDEVIGTTGIQYPVGRPDMEIGWAFRADSWGQGYAGEAAAAALAYAFEHTAAPRIIARIAPGNAGSIALALKLGMVAAPELSIDEDAAFVAQRSGREAR